MNIEFFNLLPSQKRKKIIKKTSYFFLNLFDTNVCNKKSASSLISFFSSRKSKLTFFTLSWVLGIVFN